VFEAYNVSLDDKQGKEPKSYDYFEETFLNMCQLKREHGMRWLGIGENRRRDDENEGVNNEEAPAENVENDEMNEGEAVQVEAELHGEYTEKQVEERTDSGSGDKFYDAMDDERTINEVVEAPDVVVPAPTVPAFPASPADSTNVQTKGKTMTTRVNPSGPLGSLPDSLLQHFQADFDRARTERLQAELDNACAENARLQALLQQATSHPKP
ncbi:hypothetical protein Dimus_007839, partial [Dionaea muscipula]